MKLSIILYALTLSVLPFSIASALIPRDDMNNVLVGYYDGQYFDTQIIRLARANGVMKGYLDVKSFDRVSLESVEHVDVYYAEILRGPPKVACQFSAYDVRSFVRQNDPHVFTPSNPFIPYRKHITAAIILMCQVQTDSEELEQ